MGKGQRIAENAGRANRQGRASRSGEPLAVALALLGAALLTIVAMPRIASAYTPHAPISINGNGDFTAANGVTGGSGTYNDPYVIKGWEITQDAVEGILVQNTDAHLMIQGVFIHPSGSMSYGIHVANSTNVTIDANNVQQTFEGIMVYSPGVVISGNVVSSVVDTAIWLTGSPGATVVGNNVTMGDTGIMVFVSPNTIVSANVISLFGWGIALSSDETGVRVFHNDLFANLNQANVPIIHEPAAWDDGYPSGGNHWSDYGGVDNCSGPNQDVCPNPDGIGDTPYVTSGGLVEDRYPLMTSFVDLVPPTVSITAPPDGSTVATPSTTVQGSSSDVGGDGVARVEIRVNGGSWQPCLGTTSWTASVALARGTNMIEARAWDYGGNPSWIAAVNVSFAPSVTIVNPPDNAVIAQAMFDVTGTATIATVVRVQVDTGAWQDASGTSVWSRIVGPLADGPHVIRAQAFNDSLSSAVAIIGIQVAVPIPDLTVLVPVEGQTVSGTINLSGTATAGASVLLRLDGGPWANIGLAGTDGAWSFSWNTTGLADRRHVLEFKAAKDDRESSLVSRNVTVMNRGSGGGTPPGLLPEATIIAVLLVAAAIAFLLWWRRRAAVRSSVGADSAKPSEEPGREDRADKE